MKRLMAYLVAAVIVPLLLMSCGGNPAAPVPPTETPSPIVLKFVEPSDLQIDLATISLASLSISKAVAPGGTYSDEIVFGANVTESVFNDLFIPLLGGIGQLEVPVDGSQSTYHETVDFGSHTVNEGFLFNGVHDVKLSFADFDFDNDGTLEGCSGHTAALPICVRMWVDDERYIAWVFETYPYFDDPTTSENDATPGKGRYKLFYKFALSDAFPDTWYLRIDYDLEDSEAETFDLLTHQFADDGTGWGIRLGYVSTGPAATAVKRIGYNRTLDEDGYANPANLWEEEADYLAQYREGYDFWSGSIRDCGTCKIKLDLQNLTDQCAVISTGEGTGSVDCADVGGVDIRVGSLPFLDPVDPADVALLSDFPETPPAGMFP